MRNHVETARKSSEKMQPSKAKMNMGYVGEMIYWGLKSCVDNYAWLSESERRGHEGEGIAGQQWGALHSIINF